ncbi:MAG TPA: hypothetical protein PKC49_09235 [Phycisphaerae bacterium]|nr:hypothetical protein [Phycisphaerae bacterium]
MTRRDNAEARTLTAGVLAWLVPGAGHFWLGLRGLGTVYFVAITLPFLTGVALGGVKTTVNPRANVWLFLAEMGVGGYTTVGFLASQALPDRPEYICYYPGADVAQIYLAVAGLLNVLAILDALSRAQTGGLPVNHHELKPGGAPPREAGG